MRGGMRILIFKHTTRKFPNKMGHPWMEAVGRAKVPTQRTKQLKRKKILMLTQPNTQIQN